MPSHTQPPNLAVLIRIMSLRSLIGDDPWVAALVTDPRAALEAGRRLRGGQRRIDGPFVYWDGKAGTVPVTIFVTDPASASAWFAVTRLAVRRFRPTLAIGVTPMTWCADDSAPDILVASSVLDLSPIEEDLAQAEVTAIRGLPQRVAARVNDREVAQYASPAASELLQALQNVRRTPGRGPDTGADEKPVENGGVEGVQSNRRRLDIGKLACWSRGALENRGVAQWLSERHEAMAIDCRSIGLAEAAGDCGLPWVTAGPCFPIADPARTADASLPSREAERRIALQLAATLAWVIEGIQSHPHEVR